MLDIHCHILPGVDDGARNPQMTRDMAKAAKKAGVDAIIATPHAGRRGDVERAMARFEMARAICAEQGIRLFPGCELKVSALVEDDLSAYQLGTEGFLLIEFGMDAPPPINWEYMLSELVGDGIQPVIAHPERYAFIQRDFRMAERLLHYGCELQLSAGCLIGSALMNPEKRTARRLLREGMVSYIASDAHRPAHYEAFARVRSAFAQRWPTDGALEEALKQGRGAAPPEPRP